MSEPDNAPPPLPPIYRTRVDRNGLSDILADIRALTQVLEVRVRRPDNQRADESKASLSDASAELLSGTATALQVRYRHEGAVWFDTATAVGTDAYDLVRIRHAFD